VTGQYRPNASLSRVPVGTKVRLRGTVAYYSRLIKMLVKLGFVRMSNHSHHVGLKGA
jgi:hypothetical protein